MKNRTAVVAPLFAAAILFLMPMSEKLLRLAVKGSDDIMFMSSMVQLFIFAVPAAFYCKIRNLDFFKWAKIRHVPLNSVPFVLACACTYFFGAIIVLYLEFNLLPFPASISPGEEMIASAGSMGILAAYVVIPAVCEELFFRSILLSDYSQFNGPSAVIISSIFFAMLHFSFVRFPLYFLLGLILALMTYVTGSSFPAVTVHLINNAVMIYFGNSLNSFLKESSSSVILAFILFVAFMLSFVFMLSSMESIYERRSILYETGELPGSRREAVGNMAKAGRIEQREEKVKRIESIFLSPTFFLAVALFVLITLDII